ncbi:hypothetical protein OP10G_1789 [Fimbriimonas ginsengisoli Gsoil 348]|uniref:DUF58 domain-containing protein n=2 Tax=Fimbriimonas ginsengisoli TaxID=1005039 RepID=A0A068NP66_FIMGI|nr:hypothetical protein OP10G_1789 [Fimbriimonas ginsengisoli Gsoil 348]
MLGLVYDVLLLAVAYVTTRLAPSTEGLRLKRTFDSVLSVRAANKILLTVENDGDEEVSALLRDEAPPTFFASKREFRVLLKPGQAAELVYHLTPPERGADAFRGTYLRVDCPLGLAVKEVKLPTEQPVRVYPNVLALREFDLLKQRGRLKDMGIRRSRARGLGMEFESLREYGEGDDYRKIDWKASARRGKLVVKQYEQERNQCVVICIDIGRHMLSEVNGVRKLDHVLDALLMLTNAAALAGDFVGLLVYADTVRRYIPPRKGRNQVGIVIEAIHDLIAEPVESDSAGAFAYLASRWNRRALLVNFTDYEDEDRARTLVQAFGPMARRHIALLVRVLDPRVNEVLVPLPETLTQMYAQAAATAILEDRRSAGTVVSSSGIHTLDSEPQDLAASLVSYYFLVKERSLL